MNFRDDATSAQYLRCKNSFWEKVTILRTIFDFLWLYFIGVYELLRQVVQRKLHASRFLPVTRNLPSSFEETGYIVILSGATSGIGRQIRRKLHRRGIRLILLTHPSEAGQFPENEEVLINFSSHSATKLAAQQIRNILSQTSRNFAVLFFHCAGIYNPCGSQKQKPQSLGVIQTFSVNTVMPALFLQSVSDLLTSVIYIGSASQKVAPTLSPAICPFRFAKSPYAAYPLSKMLTFAYVERWSHHNRKLAIVIHPGVVDTNLYKNGQGLICSMLRTLLRFSALSADESARRILQILDQAQVFERTIKRQSVQHDVNRTGIYWDAATMVPATLPHQIENLQLREWLFQYINSELHCWIDS